MTDTSHALFAPDPDSSSVTPLFEDSAIRPNRRLGNLLRTRRDEVGLSQLDLARLAGVHRGTIRNVEAGRPMEDGTLNNVARVLGCVPSGQALRPVISASATSTITAAILRKPDKARGAGIRWHLDLVTARAVGGRVEMGSAGEDLATYMPAGESADLRRELGVADASASIRPTAPLAELRVILNSDLPADTQTALVAHMQARRAELESALEREARVLVDQIRAHQTPDTMP